jgi:uncharacterized protein (TIGR03000 family)
MRKLVWMAALSAMALFWTADFASARGHHCGGCGSSCGGCGGGGCGGGGCGGGGCGYGGGGCGGGYGGGGYGGGGCAGGSCYAYGGGWGGGSYAMLPAAPEAQSATLVVTLPADAKLTIDDARTTSTSGERVFNTPALKVGQDFHYTLTAEVNGRTVTREVAVRGGETTRVNLDFSVQTASAK